MMKIEFDGQIYEAPVCAEEMTFAQFSRIAMLEKPTTLDIIAAAFGISKVVLSAAKVKKINLTDIADALKWIRVSITQELREIPYEIPDDVRKLGEEMTLGVYLELTIELSKELPTVDFFGRVVEICAGKIFPNVQEMPAYKVIQLADFFLRCATDSQRKFQKSKKSGSAMRRLWQRVSSVFRRSGVGS